jgi:hypothetical protein
MRVIISFLVFLLLIILGLIFIFGGHKSKPTTTTKAPVVLPLPDYASTDATVAMTLDGRVVGQDAHRAIRITISRDSRLIETIQGYNGNIIDSHSYPNTEEAYQVFLKAINNAGFMVKNKAKISADSSGQCPDGTRDIFTLNQGIDQLSNLWTSTCGLGNFGGSPDLVQGLFQAQITDYDTITSQVEL